MAQKPSQRETSSLHRGVGAVAALAIMTLALAFLTSLHGCNPPPEEAALQKEERLAPKHAAKRPGPRVSPANGND